MNNTISQFKTVILITAGFLAVFLVRTLWAAQAEAPNLFDLFSSFIVLGALIVLLRGFRNLRLGDWVVSLSLGALVGIGMLFATLFSPYPFFGVVRDYTGQAMLRGLFTLAAALVGLVIMRQGGPVKILVANGEWRSSARSILIGLVVGLPLAVLNVFALQFTDGRSISWQNPLAALLDALQPGIVEEVLYRFALWGLLWLALRKSLPEHAVTLAGLLAMLVHTYAHFSDLLVQAPLVALGMGLVLALIWGLPPYFLARKRGLEAAIAFHWLQDVTRFLAGF